MKKRTTEDSFPSTSSSISFDLQAIHLPKVQKNAYFALAILTLINLFNYIDRFVTSSTKQHFIDELELTDAESGLPMSCFLVVYMIASPIFGTLADRGYNRRLLLAIGICMMLLYFVDGSFVESCYWCDFFCE